MHLLHRFSFLEGYLLLTMYYSPQKLDLRCLLSLFVLTYESMSSPKKRQNTAQLNPLRFAEVFKERIYAQMRKKAQEYLRIPRSFDDIWA